MASEIRLVRAMESPATLRRNRSILGIRRPGYTQEKNKHKSRERSSQTIPPAQSPKPPTDALVFLPFLHIAGEAPIAKEWASVEH